MISRIWVVSSMKVADERRRSEGRNEFNIERTELTGNPVRKAWQGTGWRYRFKRTENG